MPDCGRRPRPDAGEANTKRTSSRTPRRYAGDNFARATGDALELAKTSCFAWDVERKGKAVGGDVVHVQADPSRLELERRKFEKDKASLAEETRKAVLDKYGAPETEDPDERALRSHAAASETYREFGADGRVVRGAPVAARPSKYAEDVHESGHVAVWGSYFCASSFRSGRVTKPRGAFEVQFLYAQPGACVFLNISQRNFGEFRGPVVSYRAVQDLDRPQ